ncbi:UDP-glycosyltransferase 87A1-like [Papaver somniferum]|uniref:UDP-glycosyltransferase 87A1-like n=1 Tax=Papaver somniferum TaxID=3469 RepID=UPI000E6F89A6|nr:UDP-glycosyltransferase 87A1-like [Papaver somniferum]
MMNFCKHLALKLDDSVKITFVVTEEWLHILESDPKPPQIHLRSVPNVIPSEFVRSGTLDFDSFLEIVVAEMESPIEHILNTSEPANVIIADFYFMWAISAGNQRNIPVVSFWPSTSRVFSVMYHAELLAKNGHSLTDLSDCGDKVIDYIPGVPPTRLVDMPLFPNGNDPKFNPAMVAFSMLDKVQCLLIVTIYELESQVTDTLREKFPFPTYTIGPSISNITTNIEQHHHIHRKNTESSTVKYICKSRGTFLCRMARLPTYKLRPVHRIW